MCVRAVTAIDAAEENVNWLAMSNDEVFDLWHEIRDTPELRDIAERLRLMMFAKPSIVEVA
jgi:hypothetical protein